MSRHLVLPTPDELAWMEPAGIEAALVAAGHARRLAEAALIDVLDAADSERVWATDGHRSV